VLANMRPVDEREFSRLLTEATATTMPIALVGGGSKESIGRPMNTATIVSTKGLRGVTLYEPSEMVMSARSGTPLAQIEDALAARRQMLAFEPIELAGVGGGEAGEGTIGGVFAANMSGAESSSTPSATGSAIGSAIGEQEATKMNAMLARIDRESRAPADRPHPFQRQ